MGKSKSLLLIFLAILLSSTSSWGKHIIGGELEYKCLGNGRYQILMRIYRDCRPQQDAALFDGAGNDDGAHIAIYKGNTVYELVDQHSIKLASMGFIEAPNYPCLIPPDNLCVEEGVYLFEIELGDWPSTESYHIVYQRCCRNNTISNIMNPDDHGATFSVEITPESQLVCNSSPRFTSFPPTVICVGRDINFDHSATDAEGDSLVYRFCDPLQGGGKNGTVVGENPDGCDGVRPNPPCKPPFAKLPFKLKYSAQSPLAGDPLVVIDSETGLIHGSPEVIGQFVVAVCVEEYRDGILLGRTSRDFQFNVADCDPTVQAVLKSDSKLADKEFVINSCGNNTILFENESGIEEFIDVYKWEFDVDGKLLEFTTRDAEVTFPGLGTYRGVMMVNPGLDCGDTADIYVNLYPSITADFSFTYDTCMAGPVSFVDKSFTGGDRIEQWDWDFGEGGTSSLQHPDYVYPTPGTHNIVLTATDNNQCRAQKEIPIEYYPVPTLVIIEPSTLVGCSPEDIFFNNLSIPVDSTYLVEWDFGDGQTAFEISPLHTYENIGTYSVGIEITSPIGCFTSAFYPDWIRIRESPISEFSFLPEEPSNFNPTVDFTNLGSNFIDQQWLFGNVGRSQERDPSFTFPDTGAFEVDLVTYHESGCTDTSTQIIYVLPRVTYHMPNAFTPNGDGKNDLFKGVGYTAGMTGFEMTIWTRWGELIYVSDEPDGAWNGTKHNSGEDLPVGVYVYQVRYIDPKGEPQALEGFATLIR